MLSPSFDFAQDIRKKPFILSLSKENGGSASGSERAGLSKHEINLGNSP
jgi:hypothetical protein